MICQNCGTEIAPDQQFCPNCGAEPEQEQPISAQKLVFTKKKWIAKMVYETVHTEVSVFLTELTIQQTTKKLFRKKTTLSKTIPLARIKSASIRVKFDLWDTIYAVIFAVMGIFLDPVIFLLTALFAWTAYGKVIEIVTKNGTKFSIPLAHSEEAAEKLVGICNGR